MNISALSFNTKALLSSSYNYYYLIYITTIIGAYSEEISFIFKTASVVCKNGKYYSDWSYGCVLYHLFFILKVYFVVDKLKVVLQEITNLTHFYPNLN